MTKTGCNDNSCRFALGIWEVVKRPPKHLYRVKAGFWVWFKAGEKATKAMRNAVGFWRSGKRLNPAYAA